MKVFLSAVENTTGKYVLEETKKKKIVADYVLVSYYYLRKSNISLDDLKSISKEILVDSGAHSFQKGAKVEWEKYTREYAKWIKENDCPQILGYFEMDVDNIIGYDKVLYLRKILENNSNKIIPVWHKNRGIKEYKKMCQKYSFGAITGFKNEDIKDEQYLMFLKYAKQNNCKIHCLGMTRINILNKIPFYSVDSSSWKQSGLYGNFTKFINGRLKLEKQPRSKNYKEILVDNFIEYIKLQKYFYQKWKNFKQWFADLPLLKTGETLCQTRFY